MTEEKNELYEKAFKCISDSCKTDQDILGRIIIYEKQYDYLEYQRPVNVISQDERDSHPLLTLDQIAELKARDHSNIYDFLDSETTFQELIKYTINLKSKQNQVFENLKKAIEGEKDIIEQIKALSRRRVIAIIGKNYELISGVFTYLWLTHPYNGNNPANWLLFKTPIRQYFCSLVGKYIPNRISLVYGNCNGLDVKEMKEGLYSVQHELENCSKQSKNVRLQGFELRSSALQSFEIKKMVFLRDINCNAHIEALNMMVGMIKDGLLPTEDVIVSTDTLPQGFKDQFEPIYLEPENQGRSVSIQQTKAENVFRWNEGTWEITFEGRTIRPRDSFGLRYINYLLKHPNKEIHVNALKKITANTEKGKQILLKKADGIEDDYKIEKSNGEDAKQKNGIGHGDMVDSRLKKEYEEQLKALKEEKKDAEDRGCDSEVEEIENNISLIMNELKASFDKWGRSRKFSDDTENNRTAITNCIRDSYRIIEKEHESLWKHLDKAINKGVNFSYKPETNIDWIL